MHIVLLPVRLAKSLPPIGATEAQGLDALARVKFFTPDGQWTWYASEFDGADRFFGFVVGFEPELGYFSLAELKGIRGGLGLPVERDRWFKPTPLRQLMTDAGVSWAAETPFCR
jgi:Protein of unknown function (DUF2958)